MKRSSFKIKSHKPLKRTKLRIAGKSTTSEDKREIQRLLREYVIKRDGGCIMRGRFGHVCSGFRNDGEIILQADHLNSRAHAISYADERLVVCVCKGLHGWKSVGNNLRKAEYDRKMRNLLHPEVVELWERVENESWRAVKMDWKLEILRLRQLLKKM